jgi:hypothetical protein
MTSEIPHKGDELMKGDATEMIEYRWKEGSRISLPPEIAGSHLEQLRSDHGHLTAEMVLEDARPAKSPLHDAFTWDDSEAAHKYRLEQARYIIRSVVYLPAEMTDPEPVRAFVRVQPNGDEHYTSLHVAMGDEELRRQVVLRALKELQEWRRRYAAYRELAAIFASADKVEEEVRVHA